MACQVHEGKEKVAELRGESRLGGACPDQFADFLTSMKFVNEVATAAGLTKSMLSKVESGAAYPSVAALVRIAEALGTTVAS
ncbi:MAG: XRE family transcriptional regulator, partial [Verrucomicrobia bacterium]|nr:XRE family transcriptional regulator [Verrucomicrobiota bacterium]